MPHIVFEKKELITTPSSQDGIDFKFIAKSYNFTEKERRTEYKIGLINQDKESLGFKVYDTIEKSENFKLIKLIIYSNN